MRTSHASHTASLTNAHSQNLHATATEKGIPAALAPLNDHDKVDFLNSPIVVVVCSTTGNGDAPNNAEDFWRFIRKRTHAKDMLARMQYAILGLGDTNYDKFCGAAKGIMKRFSELGATSFFASGYADESVGLETVVDPWTKQFWPALHALLSKTNADDVTAADIAPVSAPAPPAPVSVPVGGTGAVSSTDGSASGIGPSAPSTSSAASAQDAVMSPMSQMKAMMAVQAARNERRKSIGDSSHSVSAPVDNTHATPSGTTSTTMLHLHTQGVKTTWSGSSSSSDSSSSANSAVVARSDGTLPPQSADIVLDTHGLANPDAVLEAAAQAAANAVGLRAAAALVASSTRASSSAPSLPSPGPSAAPAVPTTLSGDTADTAGVSSSIPATAGARLSIRAPSPPALTSPPAALPGAPATVPALPCAATQGVRTLWEVCPSLVHHSALAGASHEQSTVLKADDIIQAAATTAAGKFFPAAPPVTVSVALLPPIVPTSLSSVSLPSANISGVVQAGQPSDEAVAPTVPLAADNVSPLPTAVGSGSMSSRVSPRAGGLSGGGVGPGPCVTPGQGTAAASNVGKSLEQPLLLPISGARYLTSGGRTSERRVIHMDVSAAGTPLSLPGAWCPGDAIGIAVPNEEQQVQALCARLGLHPLARVQVTSLCAPSAASVYSAAASTEGGADGGSVCASAPAVVGGGAGQRTPGFETQPQAAASRLKNSFSAGQLASPTPASPSGAIGASLPIYFPCWLPGWPTPKVEDVLTWCVDISSPPAKKGFLRLLADSCEEGRDKDALTWLASRGAKDAYKAFIEDQRLCLLDLLALFPSAKPSLEALLSTLPALQPRYYSLTCSPLANPSVLSVAFSVVEYELLASVGVVHSALPLDTPHPAITASATHMITNTIKRKGLATSWLERLCEPWLRPSATAPQGPVQQPTLRVFVRGSKDFTPPASLSTPMIMIGPGTGVAPFLGFLQHRASKLRAHERAGTLPVTGVWRGLHVDSHTLAREDKEVWQPLAVGSSMLFFGNRHPDIDYLYQSELQQYVSSGTLSELVTAWSRLSKAQEGTQFNKVYVQHKLAEPATSRRVAELILCRGASVYVCGDGAHMAKDVHAALVDCLNTWAQELAGGFAGNAGNGSASTAAPVASPQPSTGSAAAVPSTPATGTGAGAGTGPWAFASAAEYLQELSKRGRYVRDIWS